MGTVVRSTSPYSVLYDIYTGSVVYRVLYQHTAQKHYRVKLSHTLTLSPHHSSSKLFVSLFCSVRSMYFIIRYKKITKLQNYKPRRALLFIFIYGIMYHTELEPKILRKSRNIGIPNLHTVHKNPYTFLSSSCDVSFPNFFLSMSSTLRGRRGTKKRRKA